jgi:hypothetical protein
MHTHGGTLDNMPARYERITEFLRHSGKSVVRMTFREFEAIRQEALPNSARKYRAYWANTRPQARCWRAAGYRVSDVSLRGETLRFVKDQAGGEGGVQQPMQRQRWPAQKLLFDLDREFDRSIEVFAQQRIFTGPSLYFYERTVGMVRDADSLADLAELDVFYELVYATLTSWGLHRMGKRVAAKLTEFPTCRATVREFLGRVEDLRGVSICDLDGAEVPAMTKRLGVLVEEPGITAARAPLVANTKTLHFLLPDLVPPVDRRYTCRFFFGTTQPQGTAADLFTTVFTQLQGLAKRHEGVVRRARGGYLALGDAKILDNAIVGFVLNDPERFRPKGRSSSSSVALN